MASNWSTNSRTTSNNYQGVTLGQLRLNLKPGFGPTRGTRRAIIRYSFLPFPCFFNAFLETFLLVPEDDPFALLGLESFDGGERAAAVNNFTFLVVVVSLFLLNARDGAWTANCVRDLDNIVVAMV